MPEYAPQYSRREKIRKLATFAALLLALALAWQFCFLPWFNDLAAHSDCRTLFAMPAYAAVPHLLLTVLPLLLASLMALFVLPLAWRVLRSRQYPPLGEKTLCRTRIHRGTDALAIAVALLALLAVEIALAAFCHLEARRWVAAIHERYPDGIPCTSETVKAGQ